VKKGQKRWNNRHPIRIFGASSHGLWIPQISLFAELPENSEDRKSQFPLDDHYAGGQDGSCWQGQLQIFQWLPWLHLFNRCVRTMPSHAPCPLTLRAGKLTSGHVESIKCSDRISKTFYIKLDNRTKHQSCKDLNPVKSLTAIQVLPISMVDRVAICVPWNQAPPEHDLRTVILMHHLVVDVSTYHFVGITGRSDALINKLKSDRWNFQFFTATSSRRYWSRQCKVWWTGHAVTFFSIVGSNECPLKMEISHIFHDSASILPWTHEFWQSYYQKSHESSLYQHMHIH